MVSAKPSYEDSSDPLASAVIIESLQLDGVPVVPLESDDEANLTLNAGVAGGVVGLLVGGPILAVLTGFGTAYATRHEGASGDAARAVGQLAIEAKQKAKEVDRKHNLVLKGKLAAMEAWERTKALDRQHSLLERTKAFIVWSIQAAQEQNRKHHLMERAAYATGKVISFVATKVGTVLSEQRQQLQDGTNPPPRNPDYILDDMIPMPPPPHRAIVH